jgi:hypothetical protein
MKTKSGERKMADTYKDKVRNKIKRIANEERKDFRKKVHKLRKKGIDNAYDVVRIEDEGTSIWDRISEEDNQIANCKYSRNPSWWNREFNRVPKRRQDRDLLKVVTIENADEFDEVEWSDDNKPNLYYW